MEVDVASAERFEVRAEAALQRVRDAIANVIVPLAGKQYARAADLVEVLGLDTRLAWKLSKIIDREDALGAVPYLPGSRAVKLFLRAAAHRNAAKETLDEARRAFGALDEFVKREAGDRKSFGMMVSGQSRRLRQDAAVEHRKGAFEHNGYVWGVQARLQVHTYLIQPAGDGEHLDAAVIRGFAGLRRIRPRIPWRISRFYTVDDAGEVRGTFPRSPIDPACEPDGVPLLSDFCSPPAPPVHRRVGPLGVVDYVLAESDVGNTQSVTCLTGEIIRKAEPCYPDERHSGLGTKAPLRTPCEAIVMDMFLHRDCFGRVEPGVRLVSDLFAESLSGGYTDHDRLPLAERVEFISSGPEVPRISEMPNYADMIHYCFDQLGWPPDQFDCHRIRVPYPPLPASLLGEVPLRPRGA